MAAPIIATNWAKSCLSQAYINLHKHFTFKKHVNTWKTLQSNCQQHKSRSISSVNCISAHKRIITCRPLLRNEKIASFSTFSSKNNNKTPLPEQDDRDEDKKQPVALMEFPDQIIWPSLIKTFKNMFISWVIVRRHFDNEFDLNLFLIGAKQAVIGVSKLLSEGDAEKLRGLVSDDAIDEIKPNLTKMSLKQRQDLAVTEEDIYFGFAHVVGVMIDDNLDPQRRYVEITTVFHCVRGFEKMKETGVTFSSWQEERENISICNYRFIREFTKGVQDDWTINRLNHFKPPAVI